MTTFLPSFLLLFFLYALGGHPVKMSGCSTRELGCGDWTLLHAETQFQARIREASATLLDVEPKFKDAPLQSSISQGESKVQCQKNKAKNAPRQSSNFPIAAFDG